VFGSRLQVQPARVWPYPGTHSPPSSCTWADDSSLQVHDHGLSLSPKRLQEAGASREASSKRMRPFSDGLQHDDLTNFNVDDYFYSILKEPNTLLDSGYPLPTSTAFDEGVLSIPRTIAVTFQGVWDFLYGRNPNPWLIQFHSWTPSNEPNAVIDGIIGGGLSSRDSSGWDIVSSVSNLRLQLVMAFTIGGMQPLSFLPISNDLVFSSYILTALEASVDEYGAPDATQYKIRRGTH
jgi:hypothetical protein